MTSAVPYFLRLFTKANCPFDYLIAMASEKRGLLLSPINPQRRKRPISFSLWIVRKPTLWSLGLFLPLLAPPAWQEPAFPAGRDKSLWHDICLRVLCPSSEIHVLLWCEARHCRPWVLTCSWRACFPHKHRDLYLGWEGGDPVREPTLSNPDFSSPEFHSPLVFLKRWNFELPLV